jgi:hypothetical protein
MSSDPHRANLRQMSRFIGGYREHYYAAEEASSTHTLHMLASLGHLEIFNQALTLHKDKINLQTALVDHTPIITAAAAGHVEVTRYLLQQGADPLIPNWYGNALHCAAEANEAPAIALLLEAGMNPDTRTANGVTPLACTADNDAADAAAVLLSHGADPMNIGTERESNILFAAVQDQCPRLVSLILSRKCVDIEVKGGYFGLTALRTATLLLHVDIIQLLADATYDVAAAESCRRVAEAVQRVPVALRYDVAVQLWEMHEKEGWDTVENKILGLLEDAEGAGRFADLSMEDCTDGAMDMDEV